MAGESILIVDDTPVNLKLTRILLVNEGYKIMTAASGEEALELLRSYHPAMVLADIQLPGIDGLELTRRIKRNEATRDITVVALTAFAMCPRSRRGARRGARERRYRATAGDVQRLKRLVEPHPAALRNDKVLYGMQEVRGSNPLSSTHFSCTRSSKKETIK